MATDTRKRLALAIIDFLNLSLTDGTLQSEDAESIEIASNCIAESFHVNPSDKTAVNDALGGQNLLSIYGVYEKLKGKTAPTNQGSSSTPSAPAPASGDKGGPTDESEKLKGQGNAAMQKKDYPTAIDFYTKALEIAPLNPIYLSNRAAAYSASNQHEFAKNDAELAVATDPKYTKAWSRLGLARFALGDAQGSMDAYKSGIDAEGNGGSDAMKKGFETAKRRVEEESGAGAAKEAEEHAEESARSGTAGGFDLNSLSGMLGGGGAGGAGGAPDLGSLLQNPMMRQMAERLMSDPQQLQSLMSNPMLQGLMGGGGRGGGGAGGMPSMDNIQQMMQDPALMDMARQFMGGAGGAGAGRGAGRGA
ncbi:small glutamine-rich tetratricopeptide repeat-containing protein-like protein [Acrodontium crateriforme]|uniref:Small glutamine-rich tetratricopeptide repeat-containing protein-like protein n=1 Tax=Acrodontium crateriforme TaxID=150365 RepID=A0AAQ3RB36_9PEZI|nr:small glutamine-rich tetratricopeptide repeat-containing protein-like protein [Acrodontium crateriforme]